MKADNEVSPRSMSTWRSGLLVALAAAAVIACAVQRRVSFARDVHPILEENCLHCHTPPDGKGYKEVGLDMESWETLREGTVYGPVIVPGDSRRSILNMLVEGRADRTLRMPHKGDEPLPAEEIETLRLWVEQGAKKN
ncbi:MAG: hypothetical protein PVF51_05700 [Nitrospirota bacterium]|jgi:hypothetical protein